MLDISWTFIRSARQQLLHQLSNQKLIFVSSPTFHLIPLRNYWRFLRIHFHTHESDCRGLTMKKFSLIGCLAIICSIQKHCWLKSFHVSLLKKVLLIASVFLRSRPPKWLGRQILSQEAIGNPLVVPDFFQKKSRPILLIFLLVEFGSSKHYMVWEGVNSKFVWINATLPTLEIVVVFQFWSLAAILFTNDKKVSVVPWKLGKPSICSSYLGAGY